MRSSIKLLDAYQIKWQTSMANRHAEELVDSVHEYEDDTRREQRLAVHECKRCFYLRGRVCGQAMTEWHCGICQNRHMHHNTCTPAACHGCAKEHKLCRYCGGDLDMRRNRRKFPKPSLPQEEE